MCCYVRQGERAGALHHYRVCVEILHAEFAAVPEAATTTLYEKIRLDPDSI
jgi:DNA-binding SARP family transcriptional activator